MDKVGGPLVVTAIVVVVALVVLLAVFQFGFRGSRRRKAKGRGKSGIMSDARVEVLETTVIDADRRLVLIRCDRIEHLVMIGGPVDLVVENDVRKVRGPGAPRAKVPGLETEKTAPVFQRPAPTVAPPVEVAAAPTSPSPETHRSQPRPLTETRQAPAVARGLPPIVPTPGRSNARIADAHNAVPTVRSEEGPGGQRPQSADAKYGRRDAAPVHRPFQSAPVPTGRPSEPLRPLPSAPANDRSARPLKTAGRADPSPPLPAAQIPWSDPDSIENEIVRALRFDPNTRGGQANGRREAPSRAALDSTTTLGDLADRLEEALAREVQSASQPRRAEPGADDFEFDQVTAAPESERSRPAPQKERQERRERSETSRTAMGPAPEAESKRETPAPVERREEAPVISLNSRRRESADQLEDEMARLLGELTSDNKGR